jgi:hypothetical protein
MSPSLAGSYGVSFISRARWNTGSTPAAKKRCLGARADAAPTLRDAARSDPIRHFENAGMTIDSSAQL